MVRYRGKRIIVEDFTTSIPTMKTIGADAAKKAAPAEKNGAQATFIASARTQSRLRLKLTSQM